MASKIKKSTTKKVQKSTGIKKSTVAATTKKTGASKSVKTAATKKITAKKTAPKQQSIKKVVKKQTTPEIRKEVAPASLVQQEETSPVYSDFKPLAKKTPKNPLLRIILAIMILAAFIFSFVIITSKVKAPKPLSKANDTKNEETTKTTQETTNTQDQDANKNSMEKMGKDLQKTEITNKQTIAKKTIEKKIETKIEKKQIEPLSGEYYITEKGDTLIGISRKVYGDWKRWKEIYEANKTIIKDPTRIFPRHRLKLPEGIKRIDK